jgi:hypothetical protein
VPASEAAQPARTAARREFQRFLTEPPRPRAIARAPGAPWLAVGTVCVGAFMGQLDASIVTLALPTLQRTFHASLGAVTWVGLSYLLVLAATVTAVGRVADMAGRKLLYAYGFGVFILGSALCGLAPSLAALAGFRVLQAVGAARDHDARPGRVHRHDRGQHQYLLTGTAHGQQRRSRRYSYRLRLNIRRAVLRRGVRQIPPGKPRSGDRPSATFFVPLASSSSFMIGTTRSQRSSSS